MKPNQIPPLPLKDVHIPDAISWWPLAIGWWITMALIPILLWITYLIYKRITQKTALKTAKKILSELRQDKNKNELQKLQEIAVLMRRVAMSIAPRSECASLSGKSWLAYLDKSLKDRPFTQGIGQSLGDINYRNNIEENINLEEMFNLVERWLKAQKTRV